MSKLVVVHFSSVINRIVVGFVVVVQHWISYNFLMHFDFAQSLSRSGVHGHTVDHVRDPR
jgi:hypothetical protein